ncbi:MAG: cytochrome c4 [Pseudomonadales bacterium]|nr:cytochrome c4 [Pseudomonadales bacterium]
MKKIVISAVLACLAMTVTGAHAGGNADAGKDLATTCLACHGETGNSMAPTFPNIAGQGEKYLLKQMQDIKSDARSVPTMAGLLDNMTDQDLADIAAYYASQARSMGAAKEELVDLGESIYRAGIPHKSIAACTGCHAPSGNGNNPARFPALAGQWPEYTVQQLKAFQSGERHNDGDSQMMRGVARDMTEREMEAVASYIYGLK